MRNVNTEAKSLKILVVDDEPIAAETLSHSLTQFGYENDIVCDGVEALRQVRTGKYRIVISDIEMPRMNGIDLCREIRGRDACGYTYVILLTGRSGTDNVVEGLNSGADDYIAKPFHPAELKMRIQAGERVLLMQSRELMIFALAKLADSRDNETGSHLERIREYCQALCLELASWPEYQEMIDGIYIQSIYETSPLHDIGKVAIPDRILLKPGRLTAEEFAIMTRHAEIGGETLLAVANAHPEAVILKMAYEIAMTHHERWDGTGYPKGLAGESIPLCGRIVALADVYDALTTHRVYKPAYSHRRAVEIISESSGSHFDPAMVRAFLTLEAKFDEIRKSLDDSSQSGSSPFLPIPTAALATSPA